MEKSKQLICKSCGSVLHIVYEDIESNIAEDLFTTCPLCGTVNEVPGGILEYI